MIEAQEEKNQIIIQMAIANETEFVTVMLEVKIPENDRSMIVTSLAEVATTARSTVIDHVIVNDKNSAIVH